LPTIILSSLSIKSLFEMLLSVEKRCRGDGLTHFKADAVAGIGGLKLEER
jgi:hypothetical protein